MNHRIGLLGVTLPSTTHHLYGALLSLRPLAHEVLVELDLVPAQLNTNAYQIMAATWSLWAENSLGFLNVNQFLSMYTLARCPNELGLYFFKRHEQRKENLIT